jgi:PKD repeat protein
MNLDENKYLSLRFGTIAFILIGLLILLLHNLASWELSQAPNTLAYASNLEGSNPTNIEAIDSNSIIDRPKIAHSPGNPLFQTSSQINFDQLLTGAIRQNDGWQYEIYDNYQGACGSVGQWGIDAQSFIRWRMYTYFDTSGLNQSDIITSAKLQFRPCHVQSATDHAFNLRGYTSNWYPTLEAGDWNDKGVFVGALSTLSMEDDVIDEFNINPSYINKDGYTGFMFISDRDETSIFPDGFEYIGLYWGMNLIVNVNEDDSPPVASFTYSPETPVIDGEITFDATASYDPDGIIFSYDWGFGDGNYGAGVNVSHIYTATGKYTVTLTISDNDGLINTIEQAIEVKPLPVLLVHGYCDNASLWNDGSLPFDGPFNFKQKLIDEGFIVDTIDLGPKPTNGSIWNYGEQLAAKIAIMQNQYNVEKVDIVAHSLGGLAARAYAFQNRTERDVRKLVMLGVPNSGSGLLKEKYWFFLRKLFPEKCETSGDAGFEMRPNSPFLWRLNSAGLLPSVGAYYTIAGNKSIAGWEWITEPLLPGPDDGVVEVTSVQAIAGTINHIGNVNHVGYDDDIAIFNTIVSILGDTTSSNTAFSQPIQVQQNSPSYQESALIEDSVGVREENVHSIPVDSSVSEARFVLGSSGDELKFTFTSPGGILITPTGADGNPLITYTNTISTVTGYIIMNPEPGSWTAHVSISGTTSSEVSYAILGLFDSDLELSLLLGKYIFHTNEQVPLTAQLVNTSNPVTGATVLAQVKSPDQSTQSISLYDDGSHSDTQANDGVYTGVYSSTSETGAYEITVTASGTMDDEQFVRETASTIWTEEDNIYLPIILKN